MLDGLDRGHRGERAIRGDSIEKCLVDARVGRKLGVEGGGEQVALADEYGSVIASGENFDAGAHARDARGADEDHLDGTAGQGSRPGQDGGVDLASVGVAFHRDVERGQRRLRRVQDVFGEQDDAGAGSEGGRPADEGIEDLEEAVALQVLEEGGGFAAGDDEPVDGALAFVAEQLVRPADEDGDGAERK
jgi:hypothetical protein